MVIQSCVQQIRCEHAILVTSVRLDKAATSPTFVHGVKPDEGIRRSLTSRTGVSAPSSYQFALRLSRASGMYFSAAHCVAVRYVSVLPFHRA
jgi:hypothetical protein